MFRHRSHAPGILHRNGFYTLGGKRKSCLNHEWQGVSIERKVKSSSNKISIEEWRSEAPDTVAPGLRRKTIQMQTNVEERKYWVAVNIFLAMFQR